MDIDKDKHYSKTTILHSYIGFYIDFHLYQRYIITSTGTPGNTNLGSITIAYMDTLVFDNNTSLNKISNVQVKVWDVHLAF